MIPHHLTAKRTTCLVVQMSRLTADQVRLFLAGDHKISESGNLSSLGEQVKRLKDREWTQLAAPAIPHVSNIDAHIQAAAKEWFQLLASDPSLLNSLHKFARDDKLIVPLIPYIEWEPAIENLTAEQLQELAIAFLKQS